MPDNRIDTKNKYIVAKVSGATVNNNINKKHYTTAPTPSGKRQRNSDSFDDTLNSFNSHSSSNNDSNNFSNELENTLRLKSEETSRLVQAKFNSSKIKNNASTPNENSIDTVLQHKLSDAMKVEIDASTLCKKIELLNSLKNES